MVSTRIRLVTKGILLIKIISFVLFSLLFSYSSPFVSSDFPLLTEGAKEEDIPLSFLFPFVACPACWWFHFIFHLFPGEIKEKKEKEYFVWSVAESNFRKEKEKQKETKK